MKNLESDAELYASRLLDELEEAVAQGLLGLTEKESQELSMTLEGGKKKIAVFSAIQALTQNYDSRDILTEQLIGTLWGLGDICINWFPSKSADLLLEELFMPIFNNEIPEIRPEKSTGLHQYFQFVRAVECCAKALKLGGTKNPRSRDEAWMSTLEAFSTYAELSKGKPLPSYSKLGEMGAAKRHAPMKNLEAWAVEKYREKEWPSANKAAHDLKDQVMEYGRTIEAHLTEENAQRTIAGWFRKASKSV